MKKYQLMAPGPTPVPSEVLLAMARPMIHHRTPEYAALFDEVRAGLKRLVQTRQDVLTPACTGTGAMEAAVANTLSDGDRVIVVNAGAFAQRWMAIAKAYRLQIVELAAPHGETVTPERVAEALRTHQDVKAVLVQHSESSTGVLHDVRAYAQVTAGTDAIVIVDAVSSLGIADVPMDAWAIDVLVSASQKRLMLPPGPGIVAPRDKAGRTRRRPRPHRGQDLPDRSHGLRCGDRRDHRPGRARAGAGGSRPAGGLRRQRARRPEGLRREVLSPLLSRPARTCAKMVGF